MAVAEGGGGGVKPSNERQTTSNHGKEQWWSLFCFAFARSFLFGLFSSFSTALLYMYVYLRATVFASVSPFRHPRALSQVRPQQRGMAVVVLLCFCERSVLSQSCLACTSVSHFYPHFVLSRFRHRLSP